MKLLWKDLPGWLLRFQKANKLLLALDYDGTLTPIARTPKQAKLESKIRLLLKSISENKKIILCFATGRALEEIRGIVKIKKAIYIANHGFQIFTQGKKWIHPKTIKISKSYLGILNDLKRNLRGVPGVLIENKKQTISCHFRNTPRSLLKYVDTTVRKSLRSYSKDLKLTFGKRVYEIRPKVSWDKGKALKKVIRGLNCSKDATKIYFGDDVTDEDAFRILKLPNLSVRVGYNNKSYATYYVRNTNEVAIFLRIFKKLLVIKHKN